jgi:syntaxin 8
MVAQQQTLMDDQDERLNHLSTSINRQNQLSMQIGDELDVHHQLLEDTDGAMDRTAARLGRARKRLDKVADEAKQYGELLACRMARARSDTQARLSLLWL